MAWLDEHGLSTFLGQVKLWANKKLDTKVDKVDGKGLSANDFTDTDKEKLAGLKLVEVDTNLDVASGNAIQNSIVAEALNNATVAINENKAAIGENKAAISANTVAINEAKANISTNSADISTAKTDIDTLKTLVGGEGVNSQISDALTSALKDYATESYVIGKGYATESFVTGKGYATEGFVTGQGYATEEFVTGQGYATEGYVNDKIANLDFGDGESGSGVDLEAAKAYADSKVSEVDAAVAKHLGMGGTTVVNDIAVISPYIGGGYLNITNAENKSRVIIDPNNQTGNNYIFQVHNGSAITLGVDKNGNAAFNGDVVAKSLTLGDSVKIDATKVNGLSSVATTGSYKDLTDKPDLSDIGGLDINTENIIYKDDVEVYEEAIADGVTKQTIKVGDKEYTSIINGDFVLTDVGLGTDSADGSKNYFKIEKNGLMTAKNALVYGTVYATDGEFSGKVNATELTLGSDVKIDAGNVDGLASVATSGKYTDLSGTPAIPKAVTDLTGSANILYTDNVTIGTTTTADGVTKQSITVGDKTYTSITAGDFVYTDIGLGTDSTDGTKSFTCISKDGLLTAKNAIIYGNINATSGNIGGCGITDGKLEVPAANITGTLTIGEQLPSNIATSDQIPTDVAQLGNSSGYQTASQVTTITNNTISTTNVEAANLKVKAANITGTLTANQIDATNLTVKAANVTGTLTAATISAKQIKIDTTTPANNKVPGGSSSSNSIQLGGWYVGNNSLWYGSKFYLAPVEGVSKTVNGNSANYVIYANGNFGVTTEGKLYATGANIKGSGEFEGKITATSGKIGAWNIGAVTLGSTAVPNALYSDTHTDDNSRHKFRVAMNGYALYVLDGSTVKSMTWYQIINKLLA